MKKNLFKLAGIVMTACFAYVSTFVLQSCNSDGDELVQNVQNEAFEKDVKLAFKNDLRIFTMKQKLLNSTKKIVWNEKAGSFETTRAGGSSQEDYYTQLEENLKSILENYDLTYDLTPHELEGMNLSQEQRDIISLDMEAYQSYIEEYKTDAFCKIFEEFSKNPQNTKILEDALDNPDLKMNELLQIAIVSSVLEDNSLFQETRAARAAAVNCYDQYIGDRKSCAGFYIASAGAAFLFGGGVPGLIAGTVLAVASLDACLDTALRDYRQCRGR